jgi:class 3 adenylate cyclase
MARAFLLIADIGGYTRFMKVHRVNLAHAQYVVAQLLEALIDAAGGALKLAKLEGDAAFFYAKLPSSPEKDAAALERLSRVVADIRHGFLARRDELTIDRLCTCESCVQAGQLRLKFVAHLGEIAFQKVKRFTELAGVDVILVHRLLKNSVPVPEYVLMSEPVYDHLEPALREHARPAFEALEGLGETRTYFIDMQAIAVELPPSLRPSLLRRLWGWVRMNWRSLPYLLGWKTACAGFANMDDALSLPPRPADRPRLPPPGGTS